jgi:hypothetical protein
MPSSLSTALLGLRLSVDMAMDLRRVKLPSQEGPKAALSSVGTSVAI